jgi:hypothetical protein
MRSPKGYRGLLCKVDLTPDFKWRKLFPSEWVDSMGRVSPGAPKTCIIFPIEMTDTTAVVDFILTTEIKSGAPQETITPTPSDPAYVQRWMGIEFEVGCELYVKSASTLAPPVTPGFILCWFFYPDEKRYENEANQPRGCR